MNKYHYLILALVVIIINFGILFYISISQKAEPDRTDTEKIIEVFQEPITTDKPTTVTDSITTPVAPATTTIYQIPFLFCCYEQWWDSYKTLETVEVKIYFRTRDAGTIPTQEMMVLENKNSEYYYTSASSDYSSYDRISIYRDINNEVIPALSREACSGLYMHEVLTYLSSQNNWNWKKAVEQFDWSWMNKIVQESKIKNKKIIWSEPSYAWQTVYEDSGLDHWFENWGDTIIIMFATNFPDQVDTSKFYAKAISTKFNMPFGASIQDWYFVDQQIQATSKETEELCRYGYDNGAKYFQIEGTYSGMNPASTYINGIRSCINFISNP